VDEPGDRASKRRSSREPTQSEHADGHGGVPNKVDLGRPLSPGSKSSARSYLSHAREPGDLEGAGTSMVDGRHGREGRSRNPQQSFEGSDARVVPTCKKSANTRVTPAESMEGRRAANGTSASRNAPRAQDRQGAPTALERIGQRAKQTLLRWPLTEGGSPVREIRPPGSVRGAARKGRPYRDWRGPRVTSVPTPSRAFVSWPRKWDSFASDLRLSDRRCMTSGSRSGSSCTTSHSAARCA